MDRARPSHRSAPAPSGRQVGDPAMFTDFREKLSKQSRLISQVFPNVSLVEAHDSSRFQLRDAAPCQTLKTALMEEGCSASNVRAFDKVREHVGTFKSPYRRGRRSKPTGAGEREGVSMVLTLTRPRDHTATRPRRGLLETKILALRSRRNGHGPTDVLSA